MKILIVDDHFVIRQGILNILKKKFDKAVIFHEGEIHKALKLLRQEAWDLLILDVYFPEGSTLKYIKEIKESQSNCIILIFSAFADEKHALPFIQAGANGYLDKLSSEIEIQNAVKTVMETGKYLSDTLQEQILNNIIQGNQLVGLDILAEREMEIARLLAKGEGNLEISNKLNLQKSTISTYKKRIFKKLKINNIIELSDIFRDYETER